jgi:ADP-heptose:LPS heptosyltransferase
MDIKSRNLFRITRFVLLKVPALFRFLSVFRRKGNRRVLIIKTDAIGDYVLFRNFIELLKNSAAYSGYDIDLLCNPLCAEIAQEYDKDFVSRFFFANTEKLYEAPGKILKLGWQLFKRNYDAVLLPSYSRTFANDGLAALACARQMVGYTSDTERIDARYKNKTDHFYTRQIELPPGIYFEFDRVKYFFSCFLDETLSISEQYINCNQERDGHIVIFPGAGVERRSWERQKFLEIIKRIKKETLQTVYLAGGPAETAIAAYLEENLPTGSLINLTAKTSLVQLIELIGSAGLVISNETSAIHIAAATKTPCICILGGGHFDRFAPYPAHMSNKPVCVYHKMDCFYCNWNCIYQIPPGSPYPCIGNCTVEQVWEKVKAVLPARQNNVY